MQPIYPNSNPREQHQPSFSIKNPPHHEHPGRHPRGPGSNIRHHQEIFQREKNEALEIYKLIHIRQGEGEPFENFLLRLLDLSENTNVNRMTADDLISTLILYGIHNQEIREELLFKKPPLNKEETILFIRNKAAGKRNGQNLNHQNCGSQLKITKTIHTNTNIRKPPTNGVLQMRRLVATRQEQPLPGHQRGMQILPQVGRLRKSMLQQEK